MSAVGLKKTLIEKGYSADDLDEIVHVAVSREASAINNDGIASQLGYLLENGYTEKEIIDLLEDERVNAGLDT